MSNLVVHAIRQSGADAALPVLERLAEPDHVHRFEAERDMPIGDLQTALDVLEAAPTPSPMMRSSSRRASDLLVSLLHVWAGSKHEPATDPKVLDILLVRSVAQGTIGTVATAHDLSWLLLAQQVRDVPGLGADVGLLLTGDCPQVRLVDVQLLGLDEQMLGPDVLLDRRHGRDRLVRLAFATVVDEHVSWRVRRHPQVARRALRGGCLLGVALDLGRHDSLQLSLMEVSVWLAVFAHAV